MIGTAEVAGIQGSRASTLQNGCKKVPETWCPTASQQHSVSFLTNRMTQKLVLKRLASRMRRSRVHLVRRF